MTPPVFAHGHLRLYLLSLLEERPMHGYELIQALESRFGGTYSPSAGTIYPRLAKLEDEGLVTRVNDGRKSIYEITDAGRAEVDARREELAAVEAGVTDSVRRLADEVRSSVEEAMRSLRAELAVAARDARSAASDAGVVVGAAARGVADAFREPAPDAASAAAGTAPDAAAGSSGVGDRTTDADTTTAPGEPAPGAPGGAEGRAAARRRLEEAELLLAEFRADLRGELRSWFASTDALPSNALDALRAGLDDVRDRVRAALR